MATRSRTGRRMKTSNVLRLRLPLAVVSMLAVFMVTAPLEAQGRRGGGRGASTDTTGAGGPPSLRAMVQAGAEESDLRVAVRRFEQDQAALGRRYDVPLSPVLIERQRTFLNGWTARLDALDPAQLNQAGQVEHTALRGRIAEGLAELDAQERQLAEMAPLVPFARPIQILQEQRRDRLDVDAQQAAQTVEDVRKDVLRLTAEIEGAGREGGSAELRSITPATAAAAVEHLASLRDVLDSWYEYNYGFDPLFTWWVRKPYEELTEALEAYGGAIQRAWPSS